MLSNAEAVTVLPAEDMARAIKFYTEKLGLEILAPSSDDFTLLSTAGGSKILIYPRERTKAEHTVLTFIVENVEEAIKGLIANGVTPEQYDMPGFKTNELGIVEMEGTSSAFIKDPEGNIISIATPPV